MILKRNRLNAPFTFYEISLEDIKDAEERLARFTPFIKACFPETEATGGVIESPLQDMPRMLSITENIRIEPSSCAAFLGPLQVARTPAGHNSPTVHGITGERLQNATHICWATGGALVPEDVWEEWFKEYRLPR